MSLDFDYNFPTSVSNGGTVFFFFLVTTWRALRRKRNCVFFLPAPASPLTGEKWQKTQWWFLFLYDDRWAKREIEKTEFDFRLNGRWADAQWRFEHTQSETHIRLLTDKGKSIDPRRLKWKLKSQIGLFLQWIENKWYISLEKAVRFCARSIKINRKKIRV